VGREVNKNRLNICADGNPTDPKTWSGTPYKIYTELLKKDRCALAFDANNSKIINLVMSLCSIPFYGTSHIRRGPLRRYACALKTIIKTYMSESKHTLHMGTLSSPFAVTLSNQNHYVLCDSTWNLWNKCSTEQLACSEKTLKTFEVLEQKAYSQMKHIFSISEYVKENLMNYYGISKDKITVVGSGLGGAIVPYYGEKDYSNRKILFIAKDRFKDKGGELVVESFLKAIDYDPALHLTIVGNADIMKMVVHPNISVLGYVPLNELQELFNTHALFFMPALNEPWGLVYLEAMACRMPIIGLNRNSFPELSGYGQFGYGLDTQDPSVIGHFLAELFNNTDELCGIGLKAQEYCVKKFKWENMVDIITNVIDREYQY
jgi:glycosyltransferase involved in cell wall biosynthesis